MVQCSFAKIISYEGGPRGHFSKLMQKPLVMTNRELKKIGGVLFSFSREFHALPPRTLMDDPSILIEFFQEVCQEIKLIERVIKQLATGFSHAIGESLPSFQSLNLKHKKKIYPIFPHKKMYNSTFCRLRKTCDKINDLYVHAIYCGLVYKEHLKNSKKNV